MGRLLRGLILIILLVLPLIAAVSRDAASRQASTIPIAEQTQPFNPEITPEPATPTPYPTATPVITLDVQILMDVRHDMELLAFATVQGLPPGWNVGIDRYNPQLALLTRSDLELLATSIINPDTRPDGWIGAVGSTPFAIARDTRHDLELLADLAGYGYGKYPEGWTGADPLYSCNRSTQTLINLLERGGVYRLEVEANDPDFCYKAEIEVTRFTEMQILSNAQIGELFSRDLTILSPHNISTDVAVAFLDTGATRQVGVIPPDTPIRPIGKSSAEFSRMMLVAGDNFQVFVEHTNTTVTRQQFRNLPNVSGLEYETYCRASWCDAQ